MLAFRRILSFIFCLFVEFIPENTHASSVLDNAADDSMAPHHVYLTSSVIQDYQSFLQSKINLLSATPFLNQEEKIGILLPDLIDFQKRFMEIEYNKEIFEEKINEILSEIGINRDFLSSKEIILTPLIHIYIMNNMFDPQNGNDYFSRCLGYAAQQPEPSTSIAFLIFTTYTTLLRSVLNAYDQAIHHNVPLDSSDFTPPERPTPPPSPIHQRSKARETHRGA